MPRYQSIQYLRALAAIMVVGAHTLPGSAGLVGASGVDIFFVVSGFVMAIVSQRETRPLDFLRARVTRVAPLYWLSTLTLVVAAMLAPRAFTRLRLTFAHVLTSLTFLPHIDPSTGLVAPVLTQGWTLQYEMYFYLVMAVGLYFAPQHRLAFVGSVLSALAGIGALFADKGPLLGVVLSPLLIEFVGGMAIAGLLNVQRLPNVGAATTIFLFGIVGFAVAFVVGQAGEDHRLLAWGLPSALLVLGSISLEARGRLPLLAPMALIGDASYSLYLTHGFVVSVVTALARQLNLYAGDPMALAVTIIALSILASLVVYYFVELPLLAALRGRRPGKLVRASTAELIRPPAAE